MSAVPQVLVIDDETGSRESMAIAVEKAGWVVRSFDDAEDALSFLADHPHVQLVICDLRMPGVDGLEFVRRAREQGEYPAIILVTGYGTIENAVEAMRIGANDYLTKPVDLYELRQRVHNLIENQELRSEVSNLRQMLDKRYGFESILGQSPSMERLFEQMRMVADTNSSVLIVGESGTGKELVSKALHQTGQRSDQRFLAINCGAIPSDILESELFGHEKGSFTGAISRKIGKFELAHRGTLFLDEISELYPELQVKLLRVLEERQVMRVGSGEVIDVDFRLIAATNRDLEQLVEDGRFREDLYYRLKVVTLEVPPLRDRGEDVVLLAEHYLQRFCEEHDRGEKRFTPAALNTLRAFAWPGNVRQLRNIVESAVIFHTGEEIDVSELPREITGDLPATSAGATKSVLAPVATGMPVTMAELEKAAILDALRRSSGHRGEAAQQLEIGLRTLQRKLKQYREEGVEIPGSD